MRCSAGEAANGGELRPGVFLFMMRRGRRNLLVPTALSRIGFSECKERVVIMSERCSCGCGGSASGRSYTIPADGVVTLDKLPIGARATVVKTGAALRGRKKFADVGLVAGVELVMEAHAPFGGLIRVRIMESSMALHRDDAANIVMKLA